MRTRYLIMMTVGGVLLLVIAAAAGLAPGTSTAGQIDPTLRTIVVVTKADPPPVLRGDDVAVDLEAGAFPAGVLRATVLTDTNCAPDANGVSRCLNEMQAGSTHFTVRHNHKMEEEPCFSPTEALNVVDVATYTAMEEALQ